MPRLADPLTDSGIQSALKNPNSPRRLTDGGSGGLHLVQRANKAGQAQWRFDFKSPLTGKNDTVLLGFYGKDSDGLVTLAAAREKARELLRMIRDGKCPGAARKGAKEARKEAKAPAKSADGTTAAPGTFRAIAEEYHHSRWRENPPPGFKNQISDKHAEKWIGVLERHAFPVLGDRQIGTITQEEFLKVLQAVAHKKQAAYCLHSYSDKVFRLAIAKRLCVFNPVGDLRELGFIPKKPKGTPMRSQTTEAGAAQVIGAIFNGTPGDTNDCLRAMAWVWQRPGNVLSMRWEHLDLDAATWTIPAADMKGTIEEKETGAAHVVPLPSQAVAMLRRRLKARADGCPWVFNGQRGSRAHLAASTVRRELDRLEIRALFTPHGFRAMARTMLNEIHEFPENALEHHLAHGNGMALGQSYSRATHQPKRAQAVQVWADYLDQLSGENVMPLARAA
jgi:integrase